MHSRLISTSLLVLIFAGLLYSPGAEAKRRRAKKRYQGPPPTHPMLLWSRTLSESTDKEQRKVAAFKLSQYSQVIFQDSVINTLLKCMKDPDVQIKVLCTKAMGRAGTQSHAETIRRALLEQYAADESLRNTVVRTFIVRGDTTPKVQDTFMEAAKKTINAEELFVLLSYFERFGNGSDKFVESLAGIYRTQENPKLKRAVVKVLGDRAEGQDRVIEILAQCSQSTDTPLTLTCLAGLQLQAKKDPRAWNAVEKTILSEDPDVLMATLDVLIALPEAPSPAISKRLVELISEIDDAEIQEKAVLSLGVCGDQSEPIVQILQKLVDQKETEEAVRVAAALVLGRQAMQFPEKAKAKLTQCGKDTGSQPLRTACTLGLQELETRAKLAAKNAPAPNSSTALAPKGKREPQSQAPETKTDEPPVPSEEEAAGESG